MRILILDDIEHRHNVFDSIYHGHVVEHAYTYTDFCNKLAIESGASEEQAKEAGEEAKYKLQEKYDEEDSLPYKKLQVLEDMLGELGARIMRPYEHWNEDEAYMEYMENRYNDYDEY